MLKFFTTAFFTLYLPASTLFASPIDDRLAEMIDHAKLSILNAEQGISALPEDVYHISGMSSRKVRDLLNNLCSMPNTHYLEIGCWQGSTWISALTNNENTIESAVAIDNWSEFGGPEKEFMANCEKYLKSESYKFFNKDCFKINPKKAICSPINIYFYDGNHSEESQMKALTYYDTVLDDAFILLVDDWNWQEVKDGTYNAIKILNYDVIYQRELPSNGNGDIHNWWNGLYIAVIKKPSTR